MTYFDELRSAMLMLSSHEQTVFLGQSVRYDSNAMFRTLQTETGASIVPMSKRIELPVIEDFQMGLCIGMALQGYIPVSIFPRIDFLLLAANQLVNHLDKIPLTGGFRPAVIIRTAIGSSYPFDSGVQQSQDHTHAFKSMLQTVEVISLNSKFDVLKGYQRALERAQKGNSTLVIERQDLYRE